LSPRKYGRGPAGFGLDLWTVGPRFNPSAGNAKALHGGHGKGKA
jgi:hypothetical protein